MASPSPEPIDVESFLHLASQSALSDDLATSSAPDTLYTPVTDELAPDSESEPINVSTPASQKPTKRARVETKASVAKTSLAKAVKPDNRDHFPSGVKATLVRQFSFIPLRLVTNLADF